MINKIFKAFDKRDEHGRDDGIWMEMYMQTFRDGIEIQNNIDNFFFARNRGAGLNYNRLFLEHLAIMLSNPTRSHQ